MEGLGREKLALKQAAGKESATLEGSSCRKVALYASHRKKSAAKGEDDGKSGKYNK